MSLQKDVGNFSNPVTKMKKTAKKVTAKFAKN